MIEQTARPLNLSAAGDVRIPQPSAPYVAVNAANENGPLADAARLAAEALAREKAREALARTRAMERRRWLMLLVFVLAVLAALRLFAAQVVGIVPGMAHLYQSLGVPVQVAGLKPGAVRLRWMHGTDGGQELLVAGFVVNTATRPLPLPHIVLQLLDDAGRPLYRWQIPQRRARALAPGARMRFRSRLAEVPAQAVAVRVLLQPAKAAVSPGGR